MHVVAFELAQVGNRLRDPFAAEAVQAPKEHEVELALRGVGEHLVERLALGAALAPALVVFVDAGHVVISLLAVRTQLPELVLCVLLAASRVETQT